MRSPKPPSARASRAGGSRLRTSALAGTLALLAIAGIAAPSASAAQTHLFQRSFGSFSGASGLAVEQSSHDVYVADFNAGQVKKFNAEGEEVEGFSLTGQPEGPFNPYGLAVDQSNGDLWVASFGNATVQKYDAAGEYILQITAAALPETDLPFSPTGLATDSAGNLYVSSYERGAIEKFDSSGAFLEELGHETLPSTNGVAIDAAGDIFAIRNFSELLKLDSSGACLACEPPFDSGASAVAIDPETGHIYAAEAEAIAEFEADGTLVDRFGAGHAGFSVGLGADGESGRVYLAPFFAAEASLFGPLITVEPPQVSNLQVTAITAESAHFSATVNSGGAGAGEATEYRFACSPECPGIEGFQPLTSDGSDQSVEADATELLPAQPYTLTLVARNAGGEDEESVPFETVTLLPEVTTEPAQDIATVHTSLYGTINPHNAATTYWFEYGTSESYGTSVPASQDAHLTFYPSTALSLNLVIQALYGLEPATTYHYRLVAEDSAGKVKGADRSFTTTTPAPLGGCPNEALREEQHSTYLPDCRAYEMVSPPAKNGGDVMPQTQRTRAAASESPGLPMAASFASLTGFADVHGQSVSSEYLSQRTAQPGTPGWSTHGITPVQKPGDTTSAVIGGDHDPLFVGEFSADLTHGVFRSWSPLTTAPNVEQVPNLYMRSDLRTPGTGTWTLLSDATSPLQRNLAKPYFADASADFSHVIFESPLRLTPEAPDNQPFACAFYAQVCHPFLYESVNGLVRLAGILPDSACESPPCVPESSAAGQGIGFGDQTPHTISDDGSRVIFTDISVGTGNGDGNLYMRDDQGTESTTDDATIQLNVCEREAEDCSSQPATYWDASSGDSRVFFTSTAALTSDTPADGHTRLFMYSVQPDDLGHHLTRVADGVDGVIGASDDGHYLYLIGFGGQYGLAVWHDETGTAQIDSIGPVTVDDLRQDSSDASYALFVKASRVTPDGKHLLFAARDGTRLTGYDQTSACGPNGSFDRIFGCSELYVYSVEAEGPQGAHLQCASCNPNGVPATSDATDTVREEAGFTQISAHTARAISDDGRFVFFHTADSLLPQDTNGTWDAYVFETETGEVHLLSSGTDPSASYFLDASADGHDIFIDTRQRLLGWDLDASRDLYDVRIDGGFPEPPPRPALCEADACHPAPTAGPRVPGAASPGFNGPPNSHPAGHCPRGKRAVVIRGKKRCIRGHRRRANHNRRAGR